MARSVPQCLLTKEVAQDLKTKWLDDCILNHRDCPSRSVIPPDELPARLIKVHMVGPRPKARLINARKPGVHKDLRYLTLSHAWGNCDFIVLRNSNIEQFCRDLPLDDSSFNKTFREAITLTGLLGYQYIWIDSLCIIQDSESATDWAAECPLMGAIYANSDLTLAATGFRNALHGMQAQENRQTIIPPVIETSDGTSYLIMAYEAAQAFCPLERRGWVLQEAMLVSSLLLTLQRPSM